MYAIIEDSGSQIKVSEGDVIRVDMRELADDTVSLTFDRVLMVGGGEGEARVGQPVLEGVTVTGDLVGEDSTKTEIFKYKRRKNYRRHTGHRQHFLKVKITGIQA